MLKTLILENLKETKEKVKLSIEFEKNEITMLREKIESLRNIVYQG